METYIQSGNIVFSSVQKTPEELVRCLENKIEKRFGFPVPAVLRTTEQLRQAVLNNPFLADDGEVGILHVLFLASLPSPVDVEKLDPNRSVPDAFVSHGQEVYLRLPNGVARTQLTNSYFDTRLRTIGTMRNWRTVTRLLELMEERDQG